MTFTADGEHLIGGGEDVRVWRVRDGREIATMSEARAIYCLSVSNDGRWIAAGRGQGGLFVWQWDPKTYEVSFHAQLPHHVSGVDFSPDSTQLVTATEEYLATIWNIATRRGTRTLQHEGWVTTTKYSAEGDRIATAVFQKSILIWDSNDGRLLVNIPFQLIPNYDVGFLWLSNKLLVVSGSKIEQIDVHTGSVVSEWPVFVSDHPSCISLPQHEAFVAYSTSHTVRFWDTSARTQLDPVQCPESIQSITLSPDGRLLAIAAREKKIIVKRLSRITVSFVNCSTLACPNPYVSRNRRSISMSLRSMHGSVADSQTQMHY